MAGNVKKNKKKRRKLPKNKVHKEITIPLRKNDVKSELDKNEEIRLVISQNDIPIIEKECYEMEMKKWAESTSSDCNFEEVSPVELPKFPEPCFKVLENYNIPDLDVRPEGYIRFIERSEEELDEEVEYDMDEEDAAWLEVINQKRAENGYVPVSADIFEILMDRLEKESYFESVMSPEQQQQVQEDEALCSICNSGESQAPNAIIFCDMCNLAVHQDCYGVPYIPEGQWLCRRCLHSPSQAVDCVLCPNTIGAFKQTDRGHWAHIVCALWIPEVHFANSVFLEPIYNIETIPPARWKLTCYICRQRSSGACIQCHRKNCNLAFHVTCAQMDGLTMEPINRNEHFTVVARTAYCQNHTPSSEETSSPSLPSRKTKYIKNQSPIVSIPTIPPEKIQEISSRVMLENKSKFIKRILAYWMLKRQLRNGVPLLRRLYHLSHHDNTTKDYDLQKMQSQLVMWKRLRQDFERVRLLCELIRKREKKKRELIHVKSVALEMELCPMITHFRRMIEIIKSYDINGIFLEPVSQEEVPGYYEYIKNPMDLSTMARKVEQFEYSNFEEFQGDFNLMIKNCLNYNEKHTVYYKSAVKLRIKCNLLFETSQKDLEAIANNPGIYFGLTPEGIKPEIKTEEEEEAPLPVYNHFKGFTAADFDVELNNFMQHKFCMTRRERLTRLDELMEMVKLIKNTGLRAKRITKIKKLVYSTKKLQTGSKRKKNTKIKLEKPELVEQVPDGELTETTMENTFLLNETKQEVDSDVQEFCCTKRGRSRSLPPRT